MQEGLKDISGLGHSYDAGSPCVVDPIVEVIDATCVHNLLSGDVWAGELANAVPELCHGSVVLGATKQPHVSVGQVLWHRQGFAIWPDKSACSHSKESESACCVVGKMAQLTSTGVTVVFVCPLRAAA